MVVRNLKMSDEANKSPRFELKISLVRTSQGTKTCTIKTNLMKLKLFIIALAAAMLMSCENYNPKGLHCWEFHTKIYTWGQEGPRQETTQYFWGTKTEAQELVQSMGEQLKAAGQKYYLIDFEPTNKSQADCHE